MKKILTSGCVWSRVILIKVHNFHSNFAQALFKPYLTID